VSVLEVAPAGIVAGEKVPVTPSGASLIESWTAPLKPPPRISVRVVASLSPWARLTDVGDRTKLIEPLPPTGGSVRPPPLPPSPPLPQPAARRGARSGRRRVDFRIVFAGTSIGCTSRVVGDIDRARPPGEHVEAGACSAGRRRAILGGATRAKDRSRWSSLPYHR